MSHTDRDLTPIVEYVARSTHERLRNHAPGHVGDGMPPYDELPAMGKHALKSGLLPIITDVLAALDAVEARAAENEVLAALEAQFAADGHPSTDVPDPEG